MLEEKVGFSLSSGQTRVELEGAAYSVCVVDSLAHFIDGPMCEMHRAFPRCKYRKEVI